MKSETKTKPRASKGQVSRQARRRSDVPGGWSLRMGVSETRNYNSSCVAQSSSNITPTMDGSRSSAIRSTWPPAAASGTRQCDVEGVADRLHGLAPSRARPPGSRSKVGIGARLDREQAIALLRPVLIPASCDYCPRKLGIAASTARKMARLARECAAATSSASAVAECEMSRSGRRRPSCPLRTAMRRTWVARGRMGHVRGLNPRGRRPMLRARGGRGVGAVVHAALAGVAGRCRGRGWRCREGLGARTCKGLPNWCPLREFLSAHMAPDDAAGLSSGVGVRQGPFGLDSRSGEQESASGRSSPSENRSAPRARPDAEDDSLAPR